jgi:eukaryotic-like serine/threonine-protein kinase
MPLVAGAGLGPYQIVALLGSGGMGEVYRARDPRLGRDVAIKILPAAFSGDADRLRRFEQEARATAALNHPNIVTVYSVEQSEGVHFLTMELVEGRPLAQVIPPDGLPLDDLLAIAIPLADAVAAAHERGITHRDLKPANIMIGAGVHSGRVKVLDFGLAKLLEPDVERASTMTMPAAGTAEGRIVGTVAYMSPEQAAGKVLDARSDLFSLGVILYEMATGHRPFQGDSAVSILSSILKDTPTSIAELNRAVPPELARIVRRCLVKDPARRYQTAADLRNELEELKHDIDAGAAVVATPPVEPYARLSRGAWAAAAVVALIGAAAIYYVWGRSRVDATQTGAAGERRFTQLTTQAGVEQFPSLSPDGKWIVYDGNQSGNSDIYLQGVGGQNAINLTKDSPDDDTQPAFSPDGELIAFRSDRQGGGVFVMGRTGESVRRMSDFGYTPAWSPDGTQLVFDTFPPNLFGISTSELWVLTVATGEKRRLSNDGIQPTWSPHGYRIAYWSVFEKGGQGRRDIYTIPATGGDPLPVTSDDAIDWNPAWSPDGRYLYFSSSRGGSMNLWRIAIDERSGTVVGQPEPLTAPSSFAGHLSISADGSRLAYASLGRTSNVQKVSFDPASGAVTANPATVLGGSRFLSTVALSRDGQWLVYYTIGNQLDIAISRSDGTGERELTHDPANDRNPVWSVDGREIFIWTNRTGKNQIWSIRSDGSQLRQLTFAADGMSSYNVLSPDGSRIVYEGIAADADKMFILDLAKPWKDQTRQAFSRVIQPGLLFIESVWSPDETRLLGNGGYPSVGVFTYSFVSGRYTRLSDAGYSWCWLNDGRRVLITDRDQRKLLVLDSVSKANREILSIAPDNFESVALSADNRTIYFTRETHQGDIWLMSLK